MGTGRVCPTQSTDFASEPSRAKAVRWQASGACCQSANAAAPGLVCIFKYEKLKHDFLANLTELWWTSVECLSGRHACKTSQQDNANQRRGTTTLQASCPAFSRRLARAAVRCSAPPFHVLYFGAHSPEVAGAPSASRAKSLAAVTSSRLNLVPVLVTTRAVASPRVLWPLRVDARIASSRRRV